MDDKIKMLAAGSLDDMRKALPGLTIAQLLALKEAEQASKKRSGAYDLIDEAIDVLGGAGDIVQNDVAQDEIAQDDADPLPEARAPVPTPDAPAPDSSPTPQEPEQPAQAALKQEVLPADVEASAPMARGPLVLIVPSDQDCRREMRELVLIALDEQEDFLIMFADANGAYLPVPPIEAKASDFQRYEGSLPKLIYKPAITLPITLPSVAVRQIFLVLPYHTMMSRRPLPAAAVCRLTADLHAGGGRKAEIPDGNLLFSLS